MLVSKDLTIYHAAELKPLILDEARTAERPELDLSGVAELDSAGLQLLLLARREANSVGRDLRISGCVPAVREVLDLVVFRLDGDARA